VKEARMTTGFCGKNYKKKKKKIEKEKKLTKNDH
jgi:hypothetical protein